MKKAEMLRNGMILVPNISIEYKGFTIRPKLDMGSSPLLVDGNEYRRGYIVTRDGLQVMPGGVWFASVVEARFAIDVFVEAGEDGPTFWNLWNEYSGRNEYEAV